MRKSRILVLCLCIALGCTSTKSNIDYDPSVDFSKLENNRQVDQLSEVFTVESLVDFIERKLST